MRIRIYTTSSRLEFCHPFRIAHGVRTGTDVVLVRIEMNNHVAFGEATLPPYLPDTTETVARFFELPQLQNLTYPLAIENLFDELNREQPGCMPAKAALDMALWQLRANVENVSLSALLNISSRKVIPHSYTIGVGDFDEMQEKIVFGSDNGFQLFKLKLDGIHDEKIIENFRNISDLPFAVDANQAWNSVEDAILLAEKLKGFGCVMIEQPFGKDDVVKSRTLMESVDIPVIADEACQQESDIERLADSFSGVNIKLQKCGGITPALNMIRNARRLNLKILIGCMSESSIGCNAAEALASLCDWADLDGPYLIKNDVEILQLASSFRA